MKRIALLFLLAFALGGCASLGISSPFGNDPLTGGVDASTIKLLQIPLPIGLQYFPSHSHIIAGTPPDGVETYRGNVDQAACAINLFNNLRNAGWQLRMYQRYGKRAIFVYHKDNRMAACVFSRQGLLSILDIWVAPYLEDNASLSFAPPRGQEEPIKSFVPEEYEPINNATKNNGATEEKWGLEEKEL